MPGCTRSPRRWRYSGSLTVDTEPAGNVAANSAGLTISGQISGNSRPDQNGPRHTLSQQHEQHVHWQHFDYRRHAERGRGAAAFPPAARVTISNATLEFSAPGTFARGISLSGSGANTIQADAGVMTLSGAISGSGGLTRPATARWPSATPAIPTAAARTSPPAPCSSSGYGPEQHVRRDGRRRGRAGPQRLEPCAGEHRRQRGRDEQSAFHDLDLERRLCRRGGELCGRPFRTVPGRWPWPFPAAAC